MPHLCMRHALRCHEVPFGLCSGALSFRTRDLSLMHAAGLGKRTEITECDGQTHTQSCLFWRNTTTYTDPSTGHLNQPLICTQHFAVNHPRCCVCPGTDVLGVQKGGANRRYLASSAHSLPVLPAREGCCTVPRLRSGTTPEEMNMGYRPHTLESTKQATHTLDSSKQASKQASMPMLGATSVKEDSTVSVKANSKPHRYLLKYNVHYMKALDVVSSRVSSVPDL
eukprot:1148911-Pelagomonas_calceolata.AAC.1